MKKKILGEGQNYQYESWEENIEERIPTVRLCMKASSNLCSI
jgi:hypothetical protein